MAGPGQPTKLTDDLSLSIRKLVLQGKRRIDILVELQIDPGTWDSWYWSDTQGFRDRYNQWKRERLVILAEKNLKEFSSMQANDPATLKIKQDTAKYLTERLDKPNYAQKSEVQHSGNVTVEVVKFNTDAEPADTTTP